MQKPYETESNAVSSDVPMFGEGGAGEGALTALFKSRSIRIYEPFSDFLEGEKEENRFEITLLDVVRFAGHACPSMVGAFLMSEAAIQTLFPETGVCERGDVKIEISTLPGQGATGPIANVFGYIMGAWGETGFGGLQGKFGRRHLVQFGSSTVPDGKFKFTRLSTGGQVLVQSDPSKVSDAVDPTLTFKQQWRQRIKAMILQSNNVIGCEVISRGGARD